MPRVTSVSLFAAATLAAAVPASAAVFADQVVSYVPGAVAATWQVPGGALGQPEPQQNAPYSYEWDGVFYSGVDTSYITPFNAAYNAQQIVGIGAGGELVLRLATAVPTNGRTLGVHAAVGLADATPATATGQNLPVAMTYTGPRSADVAVAKTLGTWVSLGTIAFDVPSNHFAQGMGFGGYATGTLVAADYAKPFDSGLSSFNGQNWAGTLAVLDGSAGGTWLDLSATGLDQVNYIRFNVAADSLDPMFVDAVVAVPEPATLSLLSLVLLGLRRRRGSM